MAYQYDAAFNRNRLDYPDGSYALYAYDELGRMTTVQYDPNDSSTAPSPTTVATYAYDDLSRRTNVTLGNGTSATLSYAIDGFLSGITHTTPGGNVNFTYGRDNAGLITNLTVSDKMFAPYTDITGNNEFTPNNLNQYTSAMGQTITHDQNGNLVSNGTNTYLHDAANRLTTATVGSTTWTYAYGPLDRRVSKTDGATPTKYLYDNARAVAEYNGSGTLLRKFIYGPSLDEPIFLAVPGDDNETTYYYHADHLGSVVGLTNGAGTWAEKYAYTLYGKPATSSTIGNPYMFTGRRFDTESGLYYYRARYYDSQQRRFIETDPIGYLGGLNLYAYVKNDPINFVDPEGLSPDWFNCWASCIEKHRFDPIAVIAVFGSALPKKIVPPFRVVSQKQRLTTPLSVSAHYVRRTTPELARKMRWAGRGISKIATPILIAEGFYDWGVIFYCAFRCGELSCQN